VTTRLEIWGVTGIGEVLPGDDLAQLIAAAEPALQDGDVVVVTSKVVSKAEGRVVAMDRLDAVTLETVRVVAERGDTRIVETRHGFVLAAAGVDASNVPVGHVALLPQDPDASAQAMRKGLQALLGADVGVIVTDTFGRPWRNGLVDVAIGAAGVQVLDDHRGRTDRYGHALEMTVTAIADEIAAAAELVKGKLDDVPVAVVRGLDFAGPLSGGSSGDSGHGARALVRRADEDMFRLGTREAMRAALLALGDDITVSGPLAAAAAAPTPVADRPWQFVEEDGRIVVRLLGERTDAALTGVGAAIGNLLLALAVDGVPARWLPADGDGATIAVIELDG
jgi:coenzyme F420-0:L-glutamate ligase/coenzyme F420-1:gamma-L-glutamate ligase